MRRFRVGVIIYETIIVEAEDEDRAESEVETMIYERHPEATEVDINEVEEEWNLKYMDLEEW